MKFIITASLLTVALGAIGCSSFVDPAPSSSKPLSNIEDFYLPLKSIGTSYAYCRKSLSGADTLLMTMQGVDNSAAMNPNEVCYSTDISQTNLYLTNYYYSMNDSEAYSLGELSCGGSDKYWLDLKAPLTVGQTWKFNNIYGSSGSGSLYTAKVTRRGVQMKMPDGKLYDDVTEVIYTHASDSTVKWFARGVGLIYSTSNTPDSDFGEEMWLVGKK
jgi:hypothetical protein